MNWQRHKRALKETIKDIKYLTKIFLVGLGISGIILLITFIIVNYPIIGIPSFILATFLILYYCNL